MHVISINQFSVGQMDKLFKRADEIRQEHSAVAGRAKLAKLHYGKQLCSIFYEPSTRTRTSFETAALKLGMGVVSTENAREFSSAAKGETIEDTFQMFNQYHFDAVVMRHHEAGAAARAACISTAPLINAGDGKGEHPTQALLDAYTIKRCHGRLDNLKIVIGGDLKYGRTARSLALLLSNFKDNHITFVSTKAFKIGDDIKSALVSSGTSFSETDSMADAFKNADVVYWTRLQKERLEDGEQDPGNGFIIDTNALKLMPKNTIIMHPLPRVDEITPEVDSDPRAKYFEQAGNGLWLRMALLDMLLTNKL